jgi:AcrR family transcriptional regulator
MAESASRTVRARAREALTREIKEAARRQLAEAGAAGLSLRAVARELGLASSAIYRYFASRDQLLTALIIDAFDAIGAAAGTADATCKHDDFRGRWMAVTHAVRAWALAHRHEYALVYGTPVPGYRAPTDTVAPAARITIALLSILRDASAAGAVASDIDMRISSRARADIDRLRTRYAPEVSGAALARGLTAWTQLFGTVSFELFGHLYNVVEDYDGFFELEMREMAAFIGLGEGGRPTTASRRRSRPAKIGSVKTRPPRR